jgi:site-specific DNA recombinase
MTMTQAQDTRRVATYARVSSDDQAERGTIKTQLGELERRLGSMSDVEIVDRYADDGVSGTIRLADRPDGRRLMADAAAGRFDELHVYSPDRLGRDFIDLATVRRTFEGWGIRLITGAGGEPDLLSFDIQAAVADHARRAFLKVTADGMDRAAREGRYTGGVVAYGYRVEGVKPKAYLVPDDDVMWGDWSAAAVIRWMYERVATDDWSCRRVADELNARGVPTHSELAGTGTRQKQTRRVWRSGRIRNMIVNELYRGELRFGQRNKSREPISAKLPAIVSPKLWQAAQDTLARHRICPKNSDRVYLLMGIIKCGRCGLSYVGSQSNRKTWYRCNGQLRERGPIPGACPARNIKGHDIEPLVWRDVERFIRDPGDLLGELDAAQEQDAEAARQQREIAAIESQLGDLAVQRQRAQGLAVRGAMTDEELDAELSRIEAARAVLERHREDVAPPTQDEHLDLDLLGHLRSRLGVGLTDPQRHEIVRLLVGRITINTIVNEDGTKDAKATINYRFPAVVETRTATGSWPR